MSRFRANGGAGRGTREWRTKESRECFYVESRDCGKIIGKGGSTIQELQRSTGTRIKVWRDGMQEVDSWDTQAEVKVEIWGTEAAAKDARQRINELLQEEVSHSSRRNKTASWDDADWSDRRPQNDTHRSYHDLPKSSYRYDSDDKRQQNDTASWDDTDTDSRDERRQQDTGRYHNRGSHGSRTYQHTGGGCNSPRKGEYYNAAREQKAERRDENGRDYYSGQQRTTDYNYGDGSNPHDDDDWDDSCGGEIVDSNENGRDYDSGQQGNCSDSGGNTKGYADEEEWSAKTGGQQKAANNFEYGGDHHHDVNPADEEEMDREEKLRQSVSVNTCDWDESSSPVCTGQQPKQVHGDGGFRRQRRPQFKERRYSPDRRSENTDFRGSRNHASSYPENSVMSTFGYAEEGKDDFPKSIIYVHQDDVGRVIGKGGSRIKLIQHDCDCIIEVGRPGKDRMVPMYLIGPPDKIDKVKRRLERNVEFMEGETIEAKPMPAEEDLAPVVKNFYQEQEHIRNMSPEDVAQLRLEQNNIMVEYPASPDEKLPNPVATFRDCFGNNPEIMRQIKKQGFSDPTPIQVQAWPIIMSGYDLIGIAQTGTGKTLAFLLPAMIHIDGQTTPRKERKGPTMLVLCPTRELALQIEQEVNKINYKGIRSVCIYGGVSRKEQMIAMRQGVEIIVATPGRLLELISYGFVNLCDVTYLVLDEADRMLDMGFREDIRGISKLVRRDRQTIMTSATWPDDVQLMARVYLRNPVQVHVGSMDLSAVHTVQQDMRFMNYRDKPYCLRECLEYMGQEDKVIIFVARKVTVDEVCEDLSDNNISHESIHGGRDQDDRISSLEGFKIGKERILVATDVASRGLDVKDITMVINYDFPNSMEDYVHRIGRTGRAGRSGKAITFLTKNDVKHAQMLMKILKEADQEIPQDLLTMAALWEDDSFRERNQRRPAGRGNWRRDNFVI